MESPKLGLHGLLSLLSVPPHFWSFLVTINSRHELLINEWRKTIHNENCKSNASRIGEKEPEKRSQHTSSNSKDCLSFWSQSPRAVVCRHKGSTEEQGARKRMGHHKFKIEGRKNPHEECCG